MRAKTYLLLLFLVPILGCEKEPPSPEELYSKYRESVVLIKSDYYHEIELDDDIKFYLTGSGENIVLHQEEESAFQNADVSFGTGFIIDNQGQIATNRHVVYPELDEQNVHLELDNYFQQLRNSIYADIEASKDTLEALKSYYTEYYDALTYSEQKELETKYSQVQDRNSLYEDLVNVLQYEKEDVKINLIRKKLGVAYDNTFIEGDDDFSDCVAIKKADNQEIDLALIQLKNKRTPSYITNYVSLPQREEIEKVKLNDAVYMIGYNHGVDLAITKEGIKSQFTSGNVSQDPDNNRILYSVPTLPGSSGSPIINQWGDLVAVNYAKTFDYQGFSLGVPVRNLVDLYYDNPLPHVESSEPEERTVSQGRRDISSEVDFSNKIKSLLVSEEERNFSAIYSHFSKNLKRYWNLNYPTREDIYKQYLDSWEVVRSSENHDIYIEKVNNYNYILHTTFKYIVDKTGEYKSVKSKVRYKFNDQGKIIEVYGID